MRFKLSIWYAAHTDDDEPQTNTVTFEQAEMGLGAFLRDMEHLEGRGVRKVQVEVQS